MQFELRTQVIEPQRKTFQHLIDRYGDRPASRYEEGTVDLQAKVNFHYRPLWGPDKEIYSPDYTEFKLTDAYSFLDPRQYYYAPYVTSRADLHEGFGDTLGYLEKRGMFERLPEGWSRLLSELIIPLRHYEAAAQMISANACRFGWGTSITQCAGYAAFDRIGNAQILSRVGIAAAGGTAEGLASAKTLWLEADEFQPLRRFIEETMVERDWAKAMVALDVMDQVIYSLAFAHLDEAALTGGAGAYSLVAQHLSTWFADQRRWLDALYKAWLADEEHGEANAALLGATASAALTQAKAAITPIATQADAFASVGAAAALDNALTSVRSHMASFGAAMEEAS